jgi:hypothetical protein
MTKDTLRALYDGYRSRQLAPAELAEFRRILQDPEMEDLLNEVADEDWPVIRSEFLQDVLPERSEQIYRHITRKPYRIWPKIAVAASVLLLLSAGTSYFLVHRNHPPEVPAQTAQQDIQPGVNQATLTLANGEKIILSKGMSGQLAMQGKTSIVAKDSQIVYKSNNENIAVFNTLTTARGQQWLTPIFLDDGTKVCLNAESSLTFPTVFRGKERIVKMTGEAYFEVTHNSSQPFKVEVNGQVIEDLGTAFNVKAYADESCLRTTLLEGGVRVSSNNQMVTLKPGQESLLKEKHLSIAAADLRSATAWRNGLFHFSNADLSAVMRQLSRWYDIEVVDQTGRSGDEFMGDIPTTATLTKALHILDVSGIHFRIEGRKIILTN